MRIDDAIAFVGDEYGPTPLMITNIVLRFILNLGAALACWVPLSLFCKNRELAGAAMVIAAAIMNFYFGINSVIWPNNDIEAWVQGTVWCDVQLALWTPLETINAAAICAVMQNIANQVSLMRASSLSAQEKRRKHIIQALIIFPVPALQGILYYFTIGMRYNISGIIGCQAIFQANWIFLFFFILPCPIFAVAAAYFAGKCMHIHLTTTPTDQFVSALTWWRYRQIDAGSRRALYSSGCYGAQARSARVKRKLYLMALTIVVPYCPMQLVFLFNNLRIGWPWARTYDLAQLHPTGWAEIDYAPSTTVSFVSMYINYIVFLEVVVFFVYFGGSMDAHEMYRKYMRALGFGKIYPRLKEQWQPSDRPPTTFKTLWPRAKSLSSFVSSISSDSRSSSTSKVHNRSIEPHLSDDEDTNFLNIRLDSLDLERATATLDATRSSYRGSQVPCRGPGGFRVNIAPRFQMPKTSMNAIFSRNTDSPPVCRSQSKSAPILNPQQLTSPRPAALSQTSSADSKRRVNTNGRKDTAETLGHQASEIFSYTENVHGPKLADYGRGLVSIKRDFTSPTRQSDSGLQ